jgi:molybdopterin converting factor small subunit
VNTDPVNTDPISVELVLPGALDELSGQASTIQLKLPEGARVRDALEALAAQQPRIGRRIRDETGTVRRHVNLYVDGEDIRAGQGQHTRLVDGASILVLPSVAGG